jgi:hypothetical protein
MGNNEPIVSLQDNIEGMQQDNAVKAVSSNNVDVKNSDKITMKISSKFPQMMRSDVERYVNEIRAERGGKLSGSTVRQISDRIKVLVERDQAAATSGSSGVTAASSIPPPTSRLMGFLGNSALSGRRPSPTSSLATASSDSGREEADDDDAMCVICHEELASQKTSRLDCGHIYHMECVRKWFKEQSTCPTCRNHALLPDDFPALGGGPNKLSRT